MVTGPGPVSSTTRLSSASMSGRGLTATAADDPSVPRSTMLAATPLPAYRSVRAPPRDLPSARCRSRK